MECEGLKENDSHRPIGSSAIRSYSLVGVGVAFFKEIVLNKYLGYNMWHRDIAEGKQGERCQGGQVCEFMAPAHLSVSHSLSTY